MPCCQRQSRCFKQEEGGLGVWQSLTPNRPGDGTGRPAATPRMPCAHLPSYVACFLVALLLTQRYSCCGKGSDPQNIATDWS
jgi:hypothetical protein